MNGSMGRFRIPGMMEDINIEEIISRSKRAPVKPKPKPKAKVVKTPKQAVSKKIKKPPLTKYQKEKLKKFDEKFKGKKIKPRPKPKMPIRPNMRGGRFGLMEDIGLPPVPKKKAVAVKPKPKPKPRPRPTPPRASIVRGMEDFARAPVTTSRPKTKPKPKPKPAIVSRPKVTPRPSPIKVPTRPKISIEELMKVGSETKGRPNIPNVGMSGVIPGANINIEEIIKKATPAPVVKPPAETAQQKENIFSKIAAEANPENKSFLESAIDETKKKSESMSDKEMLAILQKIFGGQQPQEPMVIEKPQLPQVQQWNMMGPQQPTGPVVAPGFPSGPAMPGPFMPSPMPPQMPSEMFGGYGGTAPIVPAMAYAGLGNFPQMPRMPAPQYDPDAEPGGPPMPTGPVFT
jgi:ribosomal protein L12E/L44/L45/RPP1/RPP2